MRTKIEQASPQSRAALLTFSNGRLNFNQSFETIRRPSSPVLKAPAFLDPQQTGAGAFFKRDEALRAEYREAAGFYVRSLEAVRCDQIHDRTSDGPNAEPVIVVGESYRCPRLGSADDDTSRQSGAKAEQIAHVQGVQVVDRVRRILARSAKLQPLPGFAALATHVLFCP